MALDFKKSMADPPARDPGNRAIQNRIVSKTIQLGLFTRNSNAVWAAKQQLQKESYPFAILSLVVNRNLFRLQVGDTFKFSFAKYGIVEMILRILFIEESSMESEKITINCMEDIFGVAKSTTTFISTIVDHSVQPTDYTPEGFDYVKVAEAPYALSGTGIQVIPVAARMTPVDLGFELYISYDDSSYNLIDTFANIQPYGELTEEYPLTFPIDDTNGILINFSTTDVSLIDTIAWSNTLSGQNNLLSIEDEIISFTSITPVSGTIYLLEGVIRGRYGTSQAVHPIGTGAFFINQFIGQVDDTEIIAGATRYFKLVPFNNQLKGSISDSIAFPLVISGVAKTPYRVVNFCGNGASFASRYSADIILTWSARKRGTGAGIGVPGTILANSDHEGYFTVEVWVSSVLVRTETDINALTWTYSSAANISDNGALATSIEFKITNFIEEDGTTYRSVSTSLITKLSL